MKNRLNKKGQITIFVIMAAVIVAALVLFFLIYRPPTIVGGQEFNDPESFLDTCLRNEIRDKVDVMLPQGGFVNPVDYALYDDIKVAYVCKNVNYYETCVTQYPVYISTIEQELEKELQETVEGCFLLLEDELDKRNYEHSGGDVSIDITLKPGIVETVIYRDFYLSKDEFSKDFSSFRIGLKSPVYDLAYVAQEISSKEAEYCYFEYEGYMLVHPEIDIKKNTLSDSTNIYTITRKKTGETLNIAVKGCVIPPGY